MEHFPTPGKSLKGLVNQYPLIAADTQGSGIEKTDARCPTGLS